MRRGEAGRSWSACGALCSDPGLTLWRTPACPPARSSAARRRRAALSQSAEVTDKVREIIAEQLGSDLDTVVADSKFVDLGADSLDTVEIMMALEEEFSITLDEDGAEQITTVQEAADLIADQSA